MRWLIDVDAGVDVGLVGDRLGHLHACSAGRRRSSGRPRDRGHHHARQVFGFFFTNSAVRAEHLLRVVLPDVLRRDRGEADAVGDRAVAPRLADAVAVHVADAHVGDHLRRRHGDDLGVLERIDAVGRQPVVDPHRVRAGRERLRERVFALLLRHQLGERRRRRRAPLSASFFESVIAWPLWLRSSARPCPSSARRCPGARRRSGRRARAPRRARR